MMTTPVLYGYYRSSAAYRVRIALAWKGIEYETLPVHLAEGEQGSAAFLAVNPQGLVPALAIDANLLAQSQAIFEYLEETRPNPPLLPATPVARATVRRMAQIIVADVHPLNNTRILSYLRESLGQPEGAVTDWIHTWIGKGFAALEEIVAETSDGFCHGDEPSLADVCLVPQMYNARRFQMDLSPYPRLVEIDRRCGNLAEFKAAHPDRQMDAPVS